MMKLKAVRGKNQFGYSFVSDPRLVLECETILLRFNNRVVYSILRASQKVPTDAIIIDYRLFDELGCNENTELDIKAISDNIPMCGDITLSLTSVANLDNEKVAEAVSKRIEDLKPHLDGLIVREGQIIQIPALKIKFIVTQLEPSAEFDRTARISWINLLRININPVKSKQCYNVILLIDLGAISDKNGQTEPEYPSLRDMTQLIRTIFENLKHCKGVSFFTSIAYSNQSTIFQTYNQTTGEQMHFNYIDALSLLDAHDNWLMQQLDANIDTLSNPGTALEKALEIAEPIHEKNNLPTIICLCSEGAYSSGPNPVKVARINSNPEISVFCIALGNEADIEFLNAIAKAGGGLMAHIRSTEDIEQIPRTLNSWITRR